MNAGLYFKMAITGIKKNLRLYLPYLLSAAMMVTIFYLISYLSVTDALNKMKGAGELSAMLRFGQWILWFFSLIFLFYASSFLTKRRMKEYGLYNILGMGKRDIGRLIFCETVISYVGTVCVGISLGILLSRFAEMLMYKMVGGIVAYSFMIPFSSVKMSFLLFGATDFAVFLNSLRIVRRSRAIELLHSESFGEKPPKSNRLPAVIGIIILAGAYYLALAIKQPMEAFFYFVIAVVLVIIATYLIFISGSVALCKALKNNKPYYYDKRHFASVSQMTYRMKRNGAGLASICILLIMILVTMSATSCLYIGSEDCIKSSYPKEVNIRWMDYGYEYGGNVIKDRLRQDAEAVIAENGVPAAGTRTYEEYTITGLLENSNVQIVLNSQTDMAFIDYDKVCDVHFIDIDDYNRMFEDSISLNPGEAVIQTVRTNDVGDRFICGDFTWSVKKHLPDHTLDLFGSSEAGVCSAVFVFIPDMYETAKVYDGYKDYDGEDMLCHSWYYAFDPLEPQSDESLYSLTKDIYEKLNEYAHWNLYSDSRQLKRSDFYGTFGGLLFIGGILSLVFLAAAILIIYCKQVSEGCEDRKRFDIMQKVGLTKDDIRQSINSQIRILFVLPIAMAALHLAFAFPFLNKLLMLFGLLNIRLLILVTAACLLALSIIYAAAYKLTSGEYYRLVAFGE